jgi:hypothetical protein
MVVVSVRKAIAGVIPAIVAVAVLAAPHAAEAEPTDAASVYNATAIAIPAASPKALVVANGHLFVSSANTVLVLNPDGTVQTTLTELSGAAGLVANADGSTVYAALSGSGKIAAIDTTSLTVSAQWAAAPCATWLALSGGVLFFSGGCTAPSYTIGALSVTDGSTLSTGITDTFYYLPRLAVAGSTLVAGVTGLSPSPISEYSISGSTLTAAPVTATATNLEDLTASPDGTALATAAGGEYHLTTLDPDDLSQTATFDTGPYPTAVAFSHSNALLAGGLDQPYGEELYVYDRTTGRAVVSAWARVSSTVVPVLPGLLAFSEDDSRVYAVAQNFGSSSSYLMIMSTSAVDPVSLSMKVLSPIHRGGAAVVTGHISVPGAKVSLSVTSNGKVATRLLTANAAGDIHWSWVPTYSGVVSIRFAGDLTHVAVSAQRGYRAPSKMSVTLTNAYRHVGAVAHYRSPIDVRSSATVWPREAHRSISASLQLWQSGRWVTVQTVSMATGSTGRVSVHLKRAVTKSIYRIAYKFAGDSLNGRSAGATPRFLIE